MRAIFWRRRGSREVYDDMALGGYDTEHYSEEELLDLMRDWTAEDEADGDPREYWLDELSRE